jgi:hypothetical protein
VKSEKGAHWILSDYLDLAKIPLIKGMIENIKQGLIIGKTFLSFAFDLI